MSGLSNDAHLDRLRELARGIQEAQTAGGVKSRAREKAQAEAARAQAAAERAAAEEEAAGGDLAEAHKAFTDYLDAMGGQQQPAAPKPQPQNSAARKSG